MARLPRFVIPVQPQHVILRGNNRTEFMRRGPEVPIALKSALLGTPSITPEAQHQQQ